MTEEWKGSVGERLLQLRNQKGMTQEDLAEYLNVSRQSVSKWELNKTLPDVEKLMQLSELYGVTLDYLVKGIELVEENDSDAEVVVEEKEISEEAIADSKEVAAADELEKSLQERSKGDIQASPFEITAHRIIFLVAMVISGILCVCGFIFSAQIIRNHAFSLEDKEQDVTCVDKIYEQYTLADVTVWNEDEKYHNEKVWIDIHGVSEGDYVGYYYQEGASDDIQFMYYAKTIILPLIVSMVLLIFTIVFWMGFSSYGGKKATEKNS